MEGIIYHGGDRIVHVIIIIIWHTGDLLRSGLSRQPTNRLRGRHRHSLGSSFENSKIRKFENSKIRKFENSKIRPSID